MTILSINTELEIICDECDEELEFEIENNWKDITQKIRIKPCKQCLQKAEQKGYDEGYNAGFSEDRKKEE